mmetsp:Transcript_7563/g.23039  ORF Transcript_7563/g.23039 Transcript_7563/m.23039 type:complete len:240 (+) Transcript_7563:2158-2877(+)
MRRKNIVTIGVIASSLPARQGIEAMNQVMPTASVVTSLVSLRFFVVVAEAAVLVGAISSCCCWCWDAAGDASASAESVGEVASGRAGGDCEAALSRSSEVCAAAGVGRLRRILERSLSARKLERVALWSGSTRARRVGELLGLALVARRPTGVPAKAAAAAAREAEAEAATREAAVSSRCLAGRRPARMGMVPSEAMAWRRRGAPVRDWRAAPTEERMMPILTTATEGQATRATASFWS